MLLCDAKTKPCVVGDVGLLGAFEVSADAVAITLIKNGGEHRAAQALSLRIGIGSDNREIPMRGSWRMLSLDSGERNSNHRATGENERVTQNTRLIDRASQSYVLANGRVPAVGRRPERGSLQLISGPDLTAFDQLFEPRPMKAFKHPRPEAVRRTRPHGHGIIEEGARDGPGQRRHIGNGRQPSGAQTSTFEPITIVRSSGRPKYSTGSAAIRDVATNNALRQRDIPGTCPRLNSISERK